jgi:putative Mg2+ transporter-C (MgtC) family protein
VAGVTQIAAYVVSGVGFLGGGVIMRDKGSIQGINTAATLWCSAARCSPRSSNARRSWARGS